MQISVVIPCRAPGYRLERLLRSLGNCGGVEWECIITVDSRARLQELPFHAGEILRDVPCKILQASSPGVNAARVLGIENAKGKLIYLLDDDTEIFAQDQLLLAVQIANADRANSAWGGNYETPAGIGWAGAYYNFMTSVWLFCHTDANGNAQRLLGGNSLYRSDGLRGVLPDIAFVYGGTESEWQERLLHVGKKFSYQPSLSIWHHAEISWRELFRKAWYQGAGRSALNKLRTLRRPNWRRLYWQTLREPSLGMGVLILSPYWLVGWSATWLRRFNG